MDSKASPTPTTQEIQFFAVRHPDLVLSYMEGPYHREVTASLGVIHDGSRACSYMRGQQRVCLAWTAYGRNLTETVPLMCDNQSTIDLIKNPIFHQRTKHIEVRNYCV